MDSFRKMKMAVRNAVPGLSLFDSTPDPSEGERLLAVGNFAEAEQFFVRLIDQLGDRGHRRMSHAKLLFALANARYHQKKYVSAKEAALATLEQLDAAKASLELADTHDLLANILNDLKEQEAAVPHLELALETQTRIKPVDHGTIIQRRRKLATALESVEKPESALEQWREAAAVALRECGPEHQLTGDCEADLGRCLSMLDRHQEALEHLQAALKAHMVAPGAESEEVAKDYQLLATAHQETDDLEAAVMFYDKALRLRERQLGGSSADYAALLMSFASAQSLRGSYGAAVELLQQATGKFEGLRDERLGPALESLGTVYVLSGRVEDGIRTLKRARKVWEAQPEQNRERLHSNTQLFETVSGYLNPREAAVLMESIRPAEEQTYDQRHDPRSPARPAHTPPPEPPAVPVLDEDPELIAHPPQPQPSPRGGRIRPLPTPALGPSFEYETRVEPERRDAPAARTGPEYWSEEQQRYESLGGGLQSPGYGGDGAHEGGGYESFSGNASGSSAMAGGGFEVVQGSYGTAQGSGPGTGPGGTSGGERGVGVPGGYADDDMVMHSLPGDLPSTPLPPASPPLPAPGMHATGSGPGPGSGYGNEGMGQMPPPPPHAGMPGYGLHSGYPPPPYGYRSPEMVPYPQGPAPGPGRVFVPHSYAASLPPQGYPVEGAPGGAVPLASAPGPAAREVPDGAYLPWPAVPPQGGALWYGSTEPAGHLQPAASPSAMGPGMVPLPAEGLGPVTYIAARGAAAASGGFAPPPPAALPAEPVEPPTPVSADFAALRDALAAAPAPSSPPARSASLSGWDEMAFDFLPN